MTVEELMKLADSYARALAWYEINLDEAAYAHMQRKRAALEEALSLTSQFGGL